MWLEESPEWPEMRWAPPHIFHPILGVPLAPGEPADLPGQVWTWANFCVWVPFGARSLPQPRGR